jgi:hypothetical protein
MGFPSFARPEIWTLTWLWRSIRNPVGMHPADKFSNLEKLATSSITIFVTECRASVKWVATASKSGYGAYITHGNDPFFGLLIQYIGRVAAATLCFNPKTKKSEGRIECEPYQKALGRQMSWQRRSLSSLSGSRLATYAVGILASLLIGSQGIAKSSLDIRKTS